MKSKVLNKSLLFFGILLSACGVFIPQIALADIKEYPAETAMNFISYTPENPAPTPGGGTTQTGDALFWIIVALCAIIIITGITAIIISGRNKKKFKNNQPSVKNLLSVLVLPLIVSGSLLYGIDMANAASQEFVSPTMNIYVNTEGGPVHYGEGETSNIQKYTNTTDSVIFIDEINLKGESTTKFIGNWKATLEDGTVIFEGGINDSYILDEPIVLEPNESFKTTWTTETDSKELLSLTGTTPATICYKTYDAQRTVTFDSNGGSSVPAQHLYYGDKATKPYPDPVKENSNFVYWTTDSTLTNEYDFGTVVYEDLTLYAKWAATEEYKEEVEEEVADIAIDNINVIENIDNLSEEEKSAYESKIEQIVSETQELIKEAETTEEIQEIMDEYNDKIINIIAEAESAALDNEATDKISEIDNVEGLSDGDKNRYSEEINNIINKAKEDINNASSVEEITDIKVNVDEKLDGLIKEAKELGEAKKDAKEEVTSTSEIVNKFITDSEYLTDAEKEAFNKEVQNIVDKINNNIDNTIDKNKINEVLKEFDEEILEITQQVGVTEITNEKATVLDVIKRLDNLSESDNKYFENEINKEYNKVVDKINDATTAEEITKLIDEFNQNVEKIQITAETLNVIKKEAANNIDAATVKAKAELNKEPGLTEEDISRYNTEINSLVEKIQKEIDNIHNADDVKAKVTELENSINVILLKAKQLSDAKVADKAKTQEQATKAKNAISNLEALSAEIQESYKTEINDALANANSIIEAATTVEEANAAVQVLIDKIQVIESKAKELNDSKVSGIETIEEEVTEAIAHLDTLKALSESDIADIKNNIQSVEDLIKSKIDEATDTTSITEAVNKSEELIKEILDNADKFNTAKQEAYNAASTMEKETKEIINNLEMFSDKNKETFNNKINEIKINCDKNIAQAKAQDEIDKILTDTQNAINKVKADAQKLNETKTNAFQEVLIYDKQVDDIINALTGLTPEDKTAWINKVEVLKESVYNTIINANTEDEIAAALTDYKSQLDEISAGAKALSDAKLTAYENLEVDRNSAIVAITNMDSLSDNDKDKYNNIVNTIINDSISDVKTSSTTSDVASAVSASKASMAAIIAEAQAFNEIKETAYAAVSAKEAEIKNNINANEWLSTNDKNKFIQQLTEAANNSNSGIKNAENSDAVTNALSSFQESTDTINNMIVSITNAKEQCIATINEDATNSIDVINTLPCLSEIDKATHINKVNETLNNGVSDIKSCDESNINETYQTTISNINSITNEATQLSHTKEEAYNTLNSGLSSAVAVIESQGWFSSSNIQQYEAKVMIAKEQGDGTIEAATDKDSVEAASAAAITAINDIVAQAKTFNDKKAAVNQELIAYANNISADIKKIAGLSDTDKNRIESDITSQARDLWPNEIKEAVDESEIAGVVAKYKAKLDTIKTESEVLGAAKVNAYAAINERATLTINAINGLSLLSSAQKNGYIEEVNTAKTTANNNIESTDSIAAVSAAVETFKSETSSIANKASALNDKKIAAKNELTTYASSKKNAIDNLTGLVADDKTLYKNQIDTIMQNVEASIIESDEAGLSAIITNVKSQIDTIISNAETMSNARTTALATVDSKLSSIITLIDTMTNASATDRAVAKNNVNAAGALAKKNINKKVDSPEAFNEIIATMEASNLTIIKGLAGKDITAFAKTKTDAVNATDINQWDAAMINTTINSARDTGNTNINNATNIDAAMEALTTGENNINDLYNNIIKIDLVENDANTSYQDTEGHTITNKAAIKTDSNATASIKLVINKYGKEPDSITDNKGGSYMIDENSFFIVTFDQNKTITTVIKEPYAAVYTTSSENDTMEFRFDSNRSDYALTFDCADTGASTPGWSKYIGETSSGSGPVKTVNFDESFKSARPKSCYRWFANDIYYLSSTITTINNAANLGTAAVTDMSYMFAYCSGLTTPPDVSEWDTGAVTTMSNMFWNCSGLTTPPDVSEWNTGAVTTMSNMFCYCSKLTTPPDVSEWNTGTVTDMSSMFSNCSGLTEIDISSFTFTNNTQTGSTSSSTSYQSYGMFYNCSNLEKIYCNRDWSTVLNNSKSYWMFYGCTKLPNYSSWESNYYNGLAAKPKADGGVFWGPREYEGLKFTALEDNSSVLVGSLKVEQPPDVSYSYDGITWANLPLWEEISLENEGDFIYIKGDNPNGFSSDGEYSTFSFTGKISASGNINSLLDNEDGSSVIVLPCEGCYAAVFSIYEGACVGNDDALVSVKNLKLSATSLSYKCYYCMFSDNTCLVDAPELPAQTLAEQCYDSMFYNCSNLRISTTGSEENKIFTCPSTSGVGNPVVDMFTGTSGSFQGTPTAGVTYYNENAEPSSTLNYMVNIYGIGQDAVDGGAHTAGLTFGPAVGSDASCLHVDGHEVHGHSTGGHCICEDSWDEIIKNCNEGHADYYSACLDYHCAKSVPLTLNSTIGTQPSEDKYASVLYNSINNIYTVWNPEYSTSDNETTNYATSRIRSTLIGADNMTPSTYAGDNLLTSSTCLLSCFPSNLQTAIKPKYYQVPVTWQTSSSTTPPYRIDTSTYLNDKLWLMNAEEVFGTVSTYYTEWGKAQYKRNLDAGITMGAFRNNKAYNESSSADIHWLRSPNRSVFYLAGIVPGDGSCYSGYSVHSHTGLSACFCLGTSGNVIDENRVSLGLGELSKVESDSSNLASPGDIIDNSGADSGVVENQPEINVKEEKQDNSTPVAGAEVALSGLALAGVAVGYRRRLRGKHERIESNFKRFKRWYL